MKKATTILIVLFLAAWRAQADEHWLYNGTAGNPFFLTTYEDERSKAFTVPGQNYKGNAVLEIHLPGEIEAGAILGRTKSRDFSANVRNARLKFACRAVKERSTFKLGLAAATLDRRTLVTRLELPVTVTAEWQEFSFPLADFLGDRSVQFYYDAELGRTVLEPQTPFDMSRVESMKFESVPPSPCDIYVSQVRIDTSD